jgi:hypothetical protein
MNTPLKLSVQQEKLVSTLIDNPSFVLECGWGESGLNRVADIFFTDTYYAFDRAMMNDLTESAKLAGLVL